MCGLSHVCQSFLKSESKMFVTSLILIKFSPGSLLRVCITKLLAFVESTQTLSLKPRNQSSISFVIYHLHTGYSAPLIGTLNHLCQNRLKGLLCSSLQGQLELNGQYKWKVWTMKHFLSSYTEQYIIFDQLLLLLGLASIKQQILLTDCRHASY